MRLNLLRRMFGGRSAPLNPRALQARRQAARTLAFEGLEDRHLLTVQALSLADPSLFSDTAGGSALNLSGQSPGSVMSEDGRYTVFFSGAANLVAGQSDTNDSFDLFLYDGDDDSVALVSHVGGSLTTTGNGTAFEARISADGQYIVFTSTATDLLPGLDTNGAGTDVFLYEVASGNLTLVSHASGAPTVTGDSISLQPAISADGEYIAFSSGATNLVAGVDANGGDFDVFLYERTSGAVTLVSHAVGSLVTTGSVGSASATISSDGGFIAFVSRATNLVAGQADTNSDTDVFLYERSSGAVTLVSHTDGSLVTTGDAGNLFGAAISGDGDFVAFDSRSTNLVAGQVDVAGSIDVFLFDRATSGVTLVSHAAGLPATAAGGVAAAAAINSDGQRVAFESTATNLVTGQVDTNSTLDVFVYDHPGGAVTLVSHAAGLATTAGDATSRNAVISTDGLSIAFLSRATNLAAGQTDTNNEDDVFLFAAGALTLVSHAAGLPATAGNNQARAPAISGDGQFIAFASNATDLTAAVADTDNTDIFLYDRPTTVNLLVSRRDATLPSLTGNDSSETHTNVPTSTSADGRYTVFFSDATNLVAGQTDANGDEDDVFLYDRVTGSRTLVSHNSSSLTTTGDGRSSRPVISADGQFIVFESNATDLVAGVTEGNTGTDIYLYDRSDGSLKLVSHNNSSLTTTGDDSSREPLISADGQFIVFQSQATNLVTGQIDTNSSGDVFLYTRATGILTLISHTSGSLTTTGDNLSNDPAISADGQFIAFQSSATDLVAGQTDTSFTNDVFLFDRLAPAAIALVSHVSGSPTTTGNTDSQTAAISADGQFVAFESDATDLIAGVTDANTARDVFLYNRSSTTLSLVSHVAGSPAITGNAAASDPEINSDGQFLAFFSEATNLVAGMTDANGGSADVFLYHRTGDATTLVSHRAGFPTVTSDEGSSDSAAISADGRWVAFASGGSNLASGQVDANDTTDVFLFDRTTAAVRLASHISGAAPATAGGRRSSEMLISADGRFVYFESDAENLVAGDFNRSSDVFLFALNLAPLLDNSGSPGVPVIVANQVNPFGSSVASIVGSSISDPDAGALEGIAVTGLSGTSVGTWEYSINGGTVWNSFPAVAESLALLLRATDLVRYRPGASYDGSASISYHAWDQTSGTAGGTPDLSVAGATGDSSAFSTAVETAVVTELVQLVLRGSLLTVLGTGGADTFSFIAGVTHEVVLNGISYDFDPLLVTSYAFDGQGGNDTATLNGDAGADILVLFPNSGISILDGQGYLVNLTNIKEITGHGGSNDTAYLYDSAGVDTFVSTPSMSLMTDDSPTPGPDFSYLNQAIGFGAVNGVSTAGSDAAFLHGAGGSDTFVGLDTLSMLVTGGLLKQAINFDSVTGVGGGGTGDEAFLYGSSGSDTLVGTETLSFLHSTNGYFLQVVNFGAATGVSGSGGTDVAHLYDTAGNDVFVGQRGLSFLSADSGSFYQAVDFKTVHFQATQGGVDLADFRDSSDSDTFQGQDGEAHLFFSNYDLFGHSLNGTDLVRAVKTLGGTDTIELNSIDYFFQEIGEWIGP